jgi:hypothetical protein
VSLYRVRAAAAAGRAADEIDPHDLCHDDDEDEGEGVVAGDWEGDGAGADGEETAEETDGDGPLTASSPPSPSARHSRRAVRALPSSHGSLSGAAAGAAALRHHALLSRLQSQQSALSAAHSSLSHSDAKSAAYFHQLSSLSLLLQAARSAWEGAAAQAHANEQRSQRLQEELRVTKQSYECMNVELTEKVCQLTEKLAANDAFAQQAAPQRRR